LVKQLALDFRTAVEPTLDNFAVGRNAELVAHLRTMALSRTREHVLYLWGAPGSGRTHLVKGTLRAFGAAGASVKYVGSDDAIALAEEELGDTRAIGVDDVERLHEVAQVSLFNVYNSVLDNGSVLIVAGNAPPSRLALRADLTTRLASGLTYEVHGLNDAEKAQALSEHAAVRGFTLQPEVCDYLLAHVPRDMTALLEIVDTLDRYSLEAQRPVTIPLVRAMLTQREDAPR
jgi:DnaA-homolog protein